MDTFVNNMLFFENRNSLCTKEVSFLPIMYFDARVKKIITLLISRLKRIDYSKISRKFNKRLINESSKFRESKVKKS